MRPELQSQFAGVEEVLENILNLFDDLEALLLRLRVGTSNCAMCTNHALDSIGRSHG